jgi:hypothetical protein
MNVEFVEQKIDVVFNVNGKYYRVSSERQKPDSDWAVRLMDVSQNETVYSKTLDAIVTPDVQLAEDIVKMYISTYK